MVFEFPQKVLFKHCDPAGIVFFPRYFEMINDCTEAFFACAVHWPFEELLRSGGIPTASISTKFTAPCRHGEELVMTLEVERLGRTSIDLKTTTTCHSELRLVSQSRLVRVDLSGRPERWPDEARLRFQEIMDGQNVT